jgi:hypothetical protein
MLFLFTCKVVSRIKYSMLSGSSVRLLSLSRSHYDVQQQKSSQGFDARSAAKNEGISAYLEIREVSTEMMWQAIEPSEG